MRRCESCESAAPDRSELPEYSNRVVIKMEQLGELIFRLCGAPGVAGEEAPVLRAAAEELKKYASVHTDALGNLTAEMGKKDAKEHVLLDAHLDQIGLIVTRIDDEGFLHVDQCGGVDRRVLPGSPVTVLGRETLRGIVCCTPPHLAGDNEGKVLPVEKMAVDVGLSEEEARRLVFPGDRILFYSRPKKLLGTKISAAGLDDRAGVAALIRCAQLLSEEELDCRLTILCSTREETGGQGAVTGAYLAAPTQAVAVDVSFALQPDVPEENCGKLGGGPMIGVAPVLDRAMGEKLFAIARRLKMPHKADVMGGKTGTNGDEIAVSRSGVRTALISIPLRYMHTPAEVIDLRDVEYTAELLAEYIREAEV